MACKPLLESKQNKIQCRSKNPRFSTNSRTAEKKKKKKINLSSSQQNNCKKINQPKIKINLKNQLKLLQQTKNQHPRKIEYANTYASTKLHPDWPRQNKK
jgi:hypothetical protein